MDSQLLLYCRQLVHRHQILKDPHTGEYGQDEVLAILIDNIGELLKEKEHNDPSEA